MPKGGKKSFSWTPIRVAFVIAWKGSDVDAAREAGCKHPDKDAFRLMKMPEIAGAIEKKRQQMFQVSAQKIATKASKIDVVDRALKLADMKPQDTNNNISGQVQALRLVAEMQGHIINKSMNLTAQFEGRSQEELEYFAVHGYWPHSSVDPGKPGAAGNQGAGTDPRKPN